MKSTGAPESANQYRQSEKLSQTGIVVFGATGSVGISTLDVVARHPERFRVVALTAFSQVERMVELCKIHQPEYVVMVDSSAAELLHKKLSQSGLSIHVLSGQEGLEKVAILPQAEFVMAAIVGAAGLVPTLAAAKAGKRILLANKEALVMSGSIFMNVVRENNAQLLPIDSEHNAIFQCMPQSRLMSREGVKQANGSLSDLGISRILLTASGGPFRKTALNELDSITPDQACAHPVWSMGRKISVDSATMMNKGLEVIEACWLFETRPEFVQVVIHPQSVIHSMVEYVDGSVLAQLGNPDMRTPIAHALAWPERIESGVDRLNIFDIASLEFEKPDFNRFPCLKLAIEAGEQGGTAPTILNAANEIAVDAFLNGELSFPGIARVVESTLETMSTTDVDSLDTILRVDSEARHVAEESINSIKMRVH